MIEAKTSSILRDAVLAKCPYNTTNDVHVLFAITQKSNRKPTKILSPNCIHNFTRTKTFQKKHARNFLYVTCPFRTWVTLVHHYLLSFSTLSNVLLYLLISVLSRINTNSLARLCADSLHFSCLVEPHFSSINM